MERRREQDSEQPPEGTKSESHASTGGAVVAGAATGGAVGLAGGPVGAAVGAVGGAIIGAAAERLMHGGDEHEHAEGDEAHWAGDHEHTGDDDGHDHRFHYDLGYGRSPELHGPRTLELREEKLVPHTQEVQVGEVVVRKEVTEELQTIEVPVRREEFVIERHAVAPLAADRAAVPTGELERLLAERLRTLGPGEELRIPIFQEEVVPVVRQVVREELVLTKQPVQETREISGTVRREEARIERTGDVTVQDEHRG